MITIRPMFATLTALALAIPAIAQDKSRTTTYDGPNVSASQTTTVNREDGTATREREAINLNSGNTASSSAVRQRTENGSTIGIVQTGPQGNSRTLDGTRSRTEGGSTFTGSATGRAGQTYGLAGARSRDGNGNSAASQSVTNSAGESLYSRNRTTTRADGMVNRNVATTKAQGFKPPRARGKRPRG